MSEFRITEAEASRSFSELLDRVRHRGESFVVVRAGDPVCRISPIAPTRVTLSTLVHLLAAGPRPDPDFAQSLEEIIEAQPRLPSDPWES